MINIAIYYEQKSEKHALDDEYEKFQRARMYQKIWQTCLDDEYENSNVPEYTRKFDKHALDDQFGNLILSYYQVQSNKLSYTFRKCPVISNY